MLKRVIPVLLIHQGLLYKGRQFKELKYVGDPINAVKIFNKKEVDEIAVIDIDASKSGSEPNYKQIREIAGEAFMPMSYGGGIKNITQVQKVIDQGVEKVILSSVALTNLNFVTETAKKIGSSSTVVCLDVKKKLFGGYDVYIINATKKLNVNFENLIRDIETAGAGEIIINSIDRDGTMEGYDLNLLKKVNSSVNIPVVALGGAGKTEDLKAALETGASAAAAGSMFVFHGVHRAVLITYPKIEVLEEFI
ncbi:MAG: imidazole glycerol phosphate synthase subunit HisF [Saprospiraceae bacterium]|nr:imidazole glycerol phosphate synthase subunit HisF [Saprospiraceae bacterium]